MEGLIFGIMISCFLIPRVEQKNDTNMFLSKTGKKEFEKWMGIKEFLEKYTLIKERTFEEIILYDNYIPYAISLGVNKKYDNTKFDNLTYMR